MSGDPKQRLFDAIRHVIEATDEVRRAKEDYDRIYLVVVGEQAAEQKPLGVSPEPVNKSSAKPVSVQETADEDAILGSKSEDDSRWHSDRETVLAYLVEIYPDSCPKLQIARTLGVGLVRVIPALELLAGEENAMDLGSDQWRSKKPPGNP